MEEEKKKKRGNNGTGISEGRTKGEKKEQEGKKRRVYIGSLERRTFKYHFFF